MVQSLTDPNGEKHFKKGKKAITTGLLKWSPDYLEGCVEFEKAAKSFAASGLDHRSMEAWLEYSKCSEGSDEMNGAAEGLQEAAFLSKDYDQAIQWLIKADEFYKIGGYPDRGINLMKRYATELLEKETEMATKKAMELFENYLMVQVFEGDSYLLNTEIPVTYLKLQIGARDFAGAIRTKKRFIEYLRNEGTTDHQIRRSWLEVMCIQILQEDFYRLDDSLQHFANEPGHRNIYQQDEFLVAQELKDAISAKEFSKLVQVLKKPIFGYIEIEIVKMVKRFAANPPQHILQMAPLTEGGITGEESKEPVTREEALDNMLL